MFLKLTFQNSIQALKAFDKSWANVLVLVNVTNQWEKLKEN